MDRRKLIIGGAALIAAPAIVRYEWLMPVKVIVPVKPYWVKWREDQLAIRGEPLDAETELRELFRSEVRKEIDKEFVETIVRNATNANPELVKKWIGDHS